MELQITILLSDELQFFQKMLYSSRTLKVTEVDHLHRESNKNGPGSTLQGQIYKF